MFDFHQFLVAYWPRETEMHRFVQRYGVKNLTRPAIHKWYKRASIPADWFPVILALLEIDRGAPVSVAAYLKDPQ